MHDSPTSMPPTPLKIVTAGLIMLFVIVPLVALLKSGRLGSAPLLVAGGLTCVVAMLGLMFLHRIVLWIHYRFYWYVMAASYAILFMVAIVGVVGFVTEKQVAVVDTIPNWAASVLIPSGLISLIIIALVFRYGRITKTSSAITNPAPPTPAPSAPQQKQILSAAQQIAARKKDLGIDDKS